MKKIVIFTKDFASKKKGDEMKVNGMLANTLINVDKVAKLKGSKPKAKDKK